MPLVMVLVGAALPWGRSGAADRSSFELVRVARRLDVLEGAAATVAKAWLTLPLVVVVVALAGATGRRRLAVTLGTVAAALGVGLAIAVHRSPLVPRPGTWVTMAGAGLFALAVAAATLSRLHDSSEPGDQRP